MANAEHILELKKGVESWNEWRARNPNVVPDFIGFDFSDEMQWRGTPIWNENKWFRHIDLRLVNFEQSDLRNANLTFVNLTRATLNGARLNYACLSKADLEEALLLDADITGADLKGAIIKECLVTGIKYTRSGLTDACLGIRGAENCYGSPKFRRDVLDQDFIDAARKRWRSNPVSRILFLWPWAFFDYGRSWPRVVLMAAMMIIMFGFAYTAARGTHVGFDLPDRDAASYPWFIAAMGFATLGISDLVRPLDSIGQLLMMGNVLSGFVTLGLLLSVLGNSFARRA